MRILHIDDDEDDREMLQNALLKISPALEVLGASDGREGLNILKSVINTLELPNLVVVDINMPVLDGKKTLEAIRSDEFLKALLVVIFTSGTNKIDQAFFTSRHVEVINKPDSFNGLENIAKRFLEYCIK